MAIHTGSSASEESSTTADRIDLLSVLAISSAEGRPVGRTELILRLVDGGTSRLSAERIVALELGTAEASRARPRSHARR